MTPVDLRQVHVLVVEDEPLNAQLITAMLGIMGIENCRVSRSGAEIEDVAATMPRLDLVLLDLQLPGVDGFELIGELRKLERFVQAPIVAVSARVLLDSVTRARALGFAGYIGKPLNFDRFPDQIRRILAGEAIWEPT